MRPKALQWALLLAILSPIVFFACTDLTPIPFIPLKAVPQLQNTNVESGSMLALEAAQNEVSEDAFWYINDTLIARGFHTQCTLKSYGSQRIMLVVTKKNSSKTDTAFQRVRVYPATVLPASYTLLSEPGADNFAQFLTPAPDHFLILGRKGINQLFVASLGLNFNLQWRKWLNPAGTSYIQATDMQYVGNNIALSANINYNVNNHDALTINLAPDGNENWRNFRNDSLDEYYFGSLRIPTSDPDVYNMVGALQGTGIREKIVTDSYSGLESPVSHAPNDSLLPQGFEVRNTNRISPSSLLLVGYSLSGTAIKNQVIKVSAQTDKIAVVDNKWDISSLVPTINGKANCAFLTPAGKLLVAGYYAPRPDSNIAWLASINTISGTTDWVKTVSIKSETFTDVAVLPDNSIIAIGRHFNPIKKNGIMVAKFASDGTLKALKVFGTASNDDAVKLSVSGSSISILGQTTGFTGPESKIILIRTDQNLQ